MVTYDLKKVVNKLFNINLYPYQQKFLLDCMNHKRVIGVFCRQTGKSMTIAILSVIEALKHPESRVVIVAPTDRQAGELFNKITNFVQNSPVKQELKNVTQRQMILNNGSRIDAYPIGDDGTTIRGMTANVLVLEESAFIKDIIVNQVLIPMIASTDGKLIKIGTPFGVGNHFYKSFQEDSNYKSHKYTWEDAVKVGHFTQAFIDEQKKTCGSLEFKTEFEACFIAESDAYFNHKLIEDCVADVKQLSEV